jgi:hypothetical protein
MKTLTVMSLFFALALSSSTQARADGFSCQVTEAPFTVKVSNHRDPHGGSRKVETMVISDHSSGTSKPIARFSSEDGNLRSTGAHYEATVDASANELIDGLEISQLVEIDLDLNYVYNQPTEPSKGITGILTLDQRNGKSEILDVVCSRFIVDEDDNDSQ